MTSAASGSNRGPFSAFELLHRRVQRWIWDTGWDTLRDAQERAVAPIMAGDRDVIIAAATASGKTEAAWLPICSALANTADNGTADAGIKALYVSPLKALINDQHSRLDQLCQHLEIPVHRWHGDVPGSRKQALTRDPDGLLLITPESLESLFVNHGPRVAALLGGLRYVVIDELHAFIGTERGAQLQSLLHRVELAIRRQVPRVGLSATLAGPAAAAAFLRPGNAAGVHLIDDDGDDRSELLMQLRGYIAAEPTTRQVDGVAADDEYAVHGLDKQAIVEHLFQTLRGKDNLVFANSRSGVEVYADLLDTISRRLSVPNEFLPHHGNLSKEFREDVERRLKARDRPTTAICTSTLEMGIDIGSADAVAQIGAPPSVAALRQRLGRSGRRGKPATLRLYVAERELTDRTPPTDQLRAQLLQTIAMVDLLLEKWYEPPNTNSLHLSTLSQQILSVIAQHGGATAAQLFSALCSNGPFTHVDQPMFVKLLRALAQADLVIQSADGTLLHGGLGDKIVNHYAFYTAFTTAEEYRLVSNGRSLGSIPVDYPVLTGSLMIFTGRRWKVVSVDPRSKVIELTRATGGRPPLFSGTGADVADLVRRRMRDLYTDTAVAAYLDRTGQRLLDEGRATYRRLRLDHQPIVGWGNDTLLFPWRGDQIMNTLAVVLTQHDLEVGQDGVALTVRRTTPTDLADLLSHLVMQKPPDPGQLAADVPAKEADKYDEYLPDDLLGQAYAARSLDVPGAWDTMQQLVGTLGHRREETTCAGAFLTLPAEAGHTRPHTSAEPVHLGVTPFAVIDLETTGFAAHHHDRVIEIAIVHVDPDGTIGECWTTLVNPDRDPGPTHIHGITAADLTDAPRFADIVDTVIARLAGRVVVAHNLPYDDGFLAAEFERAGEDTPAWAALCTMDLADRLGDPGPRGLADCCRRENIPADAAHTARGDAQATAQLLGRYLAYARHAGFNDFPSLGCDATTTSALWHRTTSPAALKPRAQAALPPPPTAFAVAVRRAAAVPNADLRTNAYLDVLVRALADRSLTHDEVARLRDVAEVWGLTETEIVEIHERYLRQFATTLQNTDASWDTAAAPRLEVERVAALLARIS